MKYLVTGSAGFIGSKVSQVLLDQGDAVVGVDNLNDYYDRRLKEHRLSKFQGEKRFSFHNVDIENKEDLSAVVGDQEIEGVINLAARAGVRYSMVEPAIYLSTNAMGTLNLLDLMLANGIKKMVLASTSSLYAGQKMPFLETLPVNTPISPYAASKKAAESLAYSYHYLYDIDISIVRYFTVYGPAGRPDMSVFRFIKWIDEGKPIELYGDGEQTRDFTYVDDVALGTVLALAPLGHEIINIGGGAKPASLRYLIELIEKKIGRKALINQHPFHKADLVSTRADISKAKRLLDWVPTMSFEEGIEKTVDWYLENVSWLKGIKV